MFISVYMKHIVFTSFLQFLKHWPYQLLFIIVTQLYKMILTGRVWFLLLICLQCNVLKLDDKRFAFAMARNITTNCDPSCSQGITLVLCQIPPKQIFMEKCITNGEFDGSTLWKGNTIGLHVPQAVFFTLSNEKRIYHEGELNVREFYRFQLTVASNLNEFIVIFFCFNLHWIYMFILLI